MEFTANQVSNINFFVPGGFCIEPVTKGDSRPRRSEAFYLGLEENQKPVGKRVVRERKTFTEQYKPEPEPRKQGSEVYRKVNNLLKNLKLHPKSGPFLKPVDTIMYPEYLNVISDPIDLETIENRLKVGYYKNTSQLGMDIRRIWGNSYQFNAQSPDMYQATIEMSQFFELNFRSMENIALNDGKGNETVSELKKKVEKMNETIETLQYKSAPKKPSVTMQDRRTLCSDILALNNLYMPGILEIVRDSIPLKNLSIKNEEVELDIATLPVKVIAELHRYVQHCHRRQRMLERYAKSQEEKELQRQHPPAPMFHPEENNIMYEDPLMAQMISEMPEMPMFWNPYPEMTGVPEFEDIHYQ